MLGLDVSHAGELITLRPSTGSRDEIDFAERFIGPMSRVRRAYLLRAADLPALARAASAASCILYPSTTLAAFLRSQAAKLREENDFIGRFPGLYPFQTEGVAFLRSGTRRLLFDEMGLGKTPQTLCAIKPDRPALVVCPKILKSNWATECARWRPDLSPVIVDGRGAFRWPAKRECVIVNYDILPEDFSKLPLHGTHVIFDEAQAIKSWKAQRTRSSRKIIRRVLKHEGNAWLLTGTPLMNKPAELWAMLQALGTGAELYGDYTRFVKLFGGETDALGQTVWDPSAVHPQAMDPIRPYALRRTRAAVLPELPTKSYNTIQLGVPELALPAMDRAWEEYDSAIDALMARMENDAGMMSDRKRLATWKIPAMLSIVDQYENAGVPLVVFSAHRAPIEALTERQGWATIMGGSVERDFAIDAFQRGQLRGLGCTIRSAGVGITLTRGAHALFVDREWTPPANVQAEDRLCRIGQTRGVSITDLVADHPVDRSVTKLLVEKMQFAAATISQLDTPHVSRDRLAEAAELESLADDIECE